MALDTEPAILERIPFFERIPAPAREEVLARMLGRGYRRYRRHEVIYRRGDEASAMHFVLSGRVKLTISSDDGNEMVLALLAEHECFGEVAAIDGGICNETAEAVLPTTTSCLARSDVLDLCESNRHFAEAVVRLLAVRLRRADERLENFYLHNLDTRMARCLLELAERYGRVTRDGVIVDFPFTQSDLAGMLGATRVRVNILLGKYQDAGLLRLGKGELLIPQLDALRRRARLPDLGI